MSLSRSCWACFWRVSRSGADDKCGVVGVREGVGEGCCVVDVEEEEGGGEGAALWGCRG